MKPKIFPGIESLNNFAAEKFIEIANGAIKKRGKFTVALAGGATPKSLYQLLASDTFKDKIDWSKVYFFFGDERNVLPGDEESNFRMANENLFEPLEIADGQIFRWQTELEDPGKIAEDYETKIKEFFDLNVKPPTDAGGSAPRKNSSAAAGDTDGGFPRFDLILLGMGSDGHTASLFPFSKAVNENELIAAVNFVEKLNETRLTLTFPTINNAANIIFLVAGVSKAEALREVLQGEYDPEKFPAQKVKPNDGNLFWLADAQAAKLLS